MRRNKYGAKKVIINGIKFDSKKEAERYIILKGMEDREEISFLELQPRFILQESFKHEGKTHRKIEYVSDFKYWKDGDHVIEDVKGMKTDVYRLKMKLFLKKYGGKYKFIET
jgi:hypothetical protein